jgi:hypothetical protein
MTALAATKTPQLIPAGASQIQVELAQMSVRELSQVSLGRTFVFGLLEDNLTWCLIRMSSISSLTFLEHQYESEFPVHSTRKSPGELLTKLELPASGTLQFHEPPRPSQQLVVLGVSRGFIATDSFRQQQIPLAAISYLEIKQAKANHLQSTRH